MKIFKKAALLGLLGTAFLSQAAEEPQVNLDKVFAYYALVANHTNQDLFLSEWVGDFIEERLVLLKPGSTIKNIPITLRAQRSMGIELGEEIKHTAIKVSDKKNNALGYLFITLRPRTTPANLETVSIQFNSSRAGIVDEWKENIDLIKYNKIGLGINLDLKGNDLSDSTLDVAAEVR